MATSSSAALPSSSSSSSSSLPIDDFEAMLGAPMDLSLYTTGLTHTSNGGNGSGGGEGGYGLAGKREREEGGVDRGKGGAKKRPKVVIKMDED